MVIVNVQQQSTAGQAPVTAEVTGQARDLLGNRQPLTFKAVREAGGVDYLAQISVDNKQALIFDLQVRPANGVATDVQFRRTFYTEP